MVLDQNGDIVLRIEIMYWEIYSAALKVCFEEFLNWKIFQDLYLDMLEENIIVLENILNLFTISILLANSAFFTLSSLKLRLSHSLCIEICCKNNWR